MKRRFIELFLVILIAFLTIPGRVSANSAQPPSLIILVDNIDDGIDLDLILEDGEKIRALRENRAWEKIYRLYWKYDMTTEELSGARLVFSKEGSPVYALDYPEGTAKVYSQKWQLDFATKELTLEDPASRQIVLIAMRVIATLIIEGAIFFLFRYKEKRSWISFLVVNLVTQGALNIILSGRTEGYIFFGLLFMEIIILTVEPIALSLLIREKKGHVTVIYAIFANLVSLFLGAFLLTRLPI